jgi:hypothetical protein
MYTTHGKDGKFTLNISKKAEEKRTLGRSRGSGRI